MHCRPYGSKPTIAFWLLIAIADLAMLVAAAGVRVLVLILSGLVLGTGALVAARVVTHRAATTTHAVVRRRA